MHVQNTSLLYNYLMNFKVLHLSRSKILQRFLSLIILCFTFKMCQSNVIPQTQTVEVFGNATIGYYYIDIFIGQPPQKQSVVLDTGSSMLAVPCNKCQTCGSQHINPFYNLTMSHTHKMITCASQDQVCKKQGCMMDTDMIFSPTQPCRFSVYYGQGSSLKGIYIQDYISLTNKTIDDGVKVKFGCTTKQTNQFLNQKANGILGLAPNRTSFLQILLYNLTAQLDAFSRQKVILSVCLRANGGYLTIGRSQSQFHQNIQPIVTTFQSGSHFYSINSLQTVKIGHKILYNQASDGVKPAIIDSGLTYTAFPANQYNLVQQAINSQCKMHQNCQTISQKNVFCIRIWKKDNFSSWQLSDIENIVQKMFPSIKMMINSKQLAWSSVEYFALKNLTKKFADICLLILPKQNFVFGANWMINKDIVFNVNDRRISIYPQSKCSYQRHMSIKQQQEEGVSSQGKKLSDKQWVQRMPRLSAEYQIKDAKKQYKLSTKQKVLGTLFSIGSIIGIYFTFFNVSKKNIKGKRISQVEFE